MGRGPGTVNDMIRALIESEVREKRFRARALRIDPTVIEADIRYPTDAGLAGQGVKSLAPSSPSPAAGVEHLRAGPQDRLKFGDQGVLGGRAGQLSHRPRKRS